MLVRNNEDALHYLGHLNYYRLAAYWLPFEKDHATHQFRSGTSFEDVLNSYIFDRELRLLILDAIERIEVSVRTQLAHHLSLQYGTHPHLDPENFHSTPRYKNAIGILSNEVSQSGEEFIKHLTKKYSDDLPPIWAVVELMSLGQLSQWYDNLKHRSDRKLIADIYDVDEKHLRSFLHHLTTIRNCCAHHSRLWNRDFTVTLKIPSGRPVRLASSFNSQNCSSRKLYNTLVFLAHFLDIISPNHHWKSRLIALLKQHEIDVKSMGFPLDWQQRNIWS